MLTRHDPHLMEYESEDEQDIHNRPNKYRNSLSEPIKYLQGECMYPRQFDDVEIPQGAVHRPHTITTVCFVHQQRLDVMMKLFVPPKINPSIPKQLYDFDIKHPYHISNPKKDKTIYMNGAMVQILIKNADQIKIRDGNYDVGKNVTFSIHLLYPGGLENAKKENRRYSVKGKVRPYYIEPYGNKDERYTKMGIDPIDFNSINDVDVSVLSESTQRCMAELCIGLTVLNKINYTNNCDISLILIRHGIGLHNIDSGSKQVGFNLLGKLGVTNPYMDPILSNKCYEILVETGKKLNQLLKLDMSGSDKLYYKINYQVCSDLLRTRQTASIVLNQIPERNRNNNLIVIPCLHELPPKMNDGDFTLSNFLSPENTPNRSNVHDLVKHKYGVELHVYWGYYETFYKPLRDNKTFMRTRDYCSRNCFMALIQKGIESFNINRGENPTNSSIVIRTPHTSIISTQVTSHGGRKTRSQHKRITKKRVQRKTRRSKNT